MATWLIIVFALCLIGAVIKIWKPKFHTFKFVTIVVIAMTIAVNIINVNTLVAKYNVDSYLSSLNTDQARNIDIPYLGSLGPSAASATLKLYKNVNAKIQPEVLSALHMQKDILSKKSWKNACVPDFKAEQILGNIKN